MHLIVVVLLMFLPAVLHGQQAQSAASGRIVGQVIHGRTGEGLSNAGIQVVGTTTGTSSGLEGRFMLSGVTPGTVTLHIRRLGFAPKTITGILLSPGGTLEQNITLEPVTVALAAQVVSASTERGTVSEVIDKQRTAKGVVNAISRDQIAKSPDSDAAQAVQRVSGVTVSDGKYVLVRGLGERYTTTSLNGARLPSPEPEKKVVPLDLFPSSLIQTITTSKNFTPDQRGDFSGAQVDIQTREFPLRQELQFSSAMGYNDAATGQWMVLPPTLSGDWLGLAGDARRLPPTIAAAGRFEPEPSAREVNSMIRSFRNAWSPLTRKGAVNRSLSLTAGGSGSLGSIRTGYIGAFSYGFNQETRTNEVRAYADPTNGTTEIDRFEGSTGRNSILWGGILNASAMVGRNTRLALNNTYNHTADNEARREYGFSENLGAPLRIDRLRFVERSVHSTQAVLERQFGSRNNSSFSFTYSGVDRREPDRSEFVAIDPGAREQAFWLDASEGAVRTFGDLSETSYSTALDHRIQFGSVDRPIELRFGGLYSFTERTSHNSVYSLQARTLGISERTLEPEEIFDRFTTDQYSVFRIVPLAQGGSYAANDELGALYGRLDLSLGSRWEIIAGARGERSRTIVAAEPTVGRRVGADLVNNDLLPSIAVNYRAGDTHNVRFSATRTLARPEYRELAEVQYRDVLGGENIIGNPELRRSRITNLDARWEWYPRVGEVFSVGLFAKRFDDPIERVFLATSGTRVVTFINADAADNVGVELEARAGLDRLSRVLAPVTLFSNVTVMRSEIQLGRDPRVAQEKRAMVGQAPYVVNAGLTYTSAGSTSATILFNRVGRRIVSASQRPLPVTYEEPRSVLDLSLRFPVAGQLSGKFDAKNLLDAEWVQRQGTVTRESYRAGRVYTLGLTWKL